MTETETTGKALVEHWNWAADKGLMNKNTAAGLRAACGTVLGVLADEAETIDIKTLDVEDVLTRFVNLKKKDFKPAVLETYKRRFRQAVTSYLKYLGDPGGWKPRSIERAATSEKKPEAKVGSNGDLGEPSAPTGRPAKFEMPQSNMMEYPFPVRDGHIARLVLPRDLRASEVKRLSAFMLSLVVEETAAAAS